VGEGLSGEPTDLGVVTAFGQAVADFELVLASAEMARRVAEKSSDNERKIFVRKVWRRVRQLSPGNADRRELMLWVAMMGMHFGWRERLKNFSSPWDRFRQRLRSAGIRRKGREPPEILLGVCLDFRNAIEDGALKIEFHHHPESLRESGVSCRWGNSERRRCLAQ